MEIAGGSTISLPASPQMGRSNSRAAGEPGRAYFTVYCSNGLDHVGTYNDALRLPPQGWRFTRRQVRIDWQSPTSMSPPIVTR